MSVTPNCFKYEQTSFNMPVTPNCFKYEQTNFNMPVTPNCFKSELKLEKQIHNSGTLHIWNILIQELKFYGIYILSY